MKPTTYNLLLNVTYNLEREAFLSLQHYCFKIIFDTFLFSLLPPIEPHSGALTR